jgi:uncharacterized protein YciI
MPDLHHILFYDYPEDVVARRGPFREGHLDLIKQWKSDGRLVMAGAVGDPPNGGVLVFKVDDPAEIEAFVDADPYALNGVIVGRRVEPWNVV